MTNSLIDVEAHQGCIAIWEALLPSSLQQRIAIYSGRGSSNESTPIIGHPANKSHSPALEGSIKMTPDTGEDHSRNEDFHQVLER
jgi:hypothetical protein